MGAVANTGVNQAVGVGVGADADYTFKNLGSRADLGEYTADYKWIYDPFGRRLAEISAPYGAAATVTLFGYDGLQQIEALDVVSGSPPVCQKALYVYGPGGLDELVAMALENGKVKGLNLLTEGFFAYTDAQDSVVALTQLIYDDVVERYAYSAFGAPTIYEPDGTTERTASLYNNTRLYTGRPWNADLGLYDYRNRQYDPAQGRFITPDPIGPYGDWNNLGNPYAYVGNNPGAFTDPLGLERWGAQSYFADVADVGYGYFLGGIVDTATAAWELRHYSVGGYFGDLASGAGIAASGIAGAVGAIVSDPVAAVGKGVSVFYSQFEDSDTAGQATFAVASLAAVPIASTGVAAPAANAITKARAFLTGTGMAAGTAQSAMRARVLANLEASANATATSNIDVHLATEGIYINAQKAVTAAKDAGLSSTNGAFGMYAHKEFAALNLVTRERLGGRGIWIEIEPYVDDLKKTVPAGTAGSLSVDTLLQYRGANVRGFDLKTGRPWTRAGVLERVSRFKSPMQQIQR